MVRFILLGALLLAQGAFAEPNFPPPEFSQPYRFPDLSTPAPREALLGYVDIGVLLVTLALAAYFSIWRRSRRDMVVLVVFSLLYFGFYRQGCVCSVGSIQNVALALWNPGYAVTLTVGAFFLLPLLFALFFGRVFCAAVCPLGVAQELVLLRPLRAPRWLDHSLGIIPFVYLGFAVLLAATDSRFIICEADPFVLFFRLGGSPKMLAAGALVLLLATVVGRPYCRYLCPYGVLLRLLAPLARWQPKITAGDCVTCHLCADACPYNAIRPPTTHHGVKSRTEGKTRLTVLVALLPVFVLLGGIATRLSSPVIARSNHTVRLAERVWLEEQGIFEEQTEDSEAFEATGVPSTDLYADATKIRGRFDTGSWYLGAWIGLVFGLRMIGLSVRRRRDIYEADPAACVNCGRCYASCPVEHDRVKAASELQSGEGQ